MNLILGDCLKVLKGMASESVGHIVSDPPYAQTNEAYDSAIATRPDVWRECYRVTGRNAALVAFAGSPTYHRIASAIEAAGWKVRQMWAWVYRDGLITSAWPSEGFDRLAPAFDPIVFATKGKVLLRLDREGVSWSRPNRSNLSPLSNRSSAPKTKAANGRYSRAIVSDGVAPFEYFVSPRTTSRLGDPTDHPNQKPLEVMRWIVAKLPKTGSVLDPFAGSATTLLAAHAEGFEGIGIEQNAEYHNIGRRRLTTALKAP